MLDDARENVGAPTSQRMQKRSPERYTGYMALMGECVVREPSFFKEAVQQLVWVDAMVEKYDSVFHNSVWDMVPRLEDKSMVRSHCLYKVRKLQIVVWRSLRLDCGSCLFTGKGD